MVEIDFDKRPDLRPGFWPDYVEPTPMERAIQMPLHPTERWISGVLNAHVQRKRASPPSPLQDRESTHG